MALFQTTMFDRAKLNLELTETAVDKAKNRSTVRIQAYISGQYTFNGYPHTLKLYINGNLQESATRTGLSYDLRKQTRFDWYDGSWYINHQADGTGSAAVEIEVTSTAGDYAKVSGTLALTPISKDEPLQIQDTYIWLGSTVTINPNLASNEAGVLYVKIGQKEIKIGDAGQGPFEWNVSKSLAEHFPDTASQTATLILRIVQGLNTREETITIQLNKPREMMVKPEISNFTMKELNSKITQNIGNVWLSLQSQIYFRADVKSLYGASIQSAILKLEFSDGADYKTMSIKSGFVDAVYSNPLIGQIKASIEVTDSNGGVSVSDIKTFNVLAYFPPAIVEASAARDQNDKTKINLSAKVVNAHINGRNTLTLKLFVMDSNGQYKQIGTTQTSNNGSITYKHTLTDAQEMASYQFMIKANDELVDQVSSALSVSTATGLFDFFEDKALGVGKLVNPAMPYNLTVASGGIQSDGNIETEGVLRIGYMTLSQDELAKLKKLIN